MTDESQAGDLGGVSSNLNVNKNGFNPKFNGMNAKKDVKVVQAKKEKVIEPKLV